MAQITTTNFGKLGIIPFQPLSNVSETFSHLTDIMQAVDGSESRVPLRHRPRVEYSYTFPAQIFDTPALYNLLYSALRNKFAIPVWTQGVRLHSTTLVGSDSLRIANDIDFYDFYTNGLALLYESPKKWRILEITNIIGDVLEFADETIQSWGVSDSWVIPVQIGYIKDKVTRNTNGYASKYELTYEVIDNPTPKFFETPTQFKGYDVFTTEGLFSSGTIARDIFSQIDEVDQEIGPTFKRTQWRNSRYAYNHNVFCETPGEVAALKARFNRHIGKCNPFWQPTFDINIRVKSINVVSKTIDIHSDDYGKFQDHKFVGFKSMSSGAFNIREILSAAPVDFETTRLQLDDEPGLELKDIYYVSYMGFCRLDSDTLEIRWLGNGLSESTLRIVELSPDSPT